LCQERKPKSRDEPVFPEKREKKELASVGEGEKPWHVPQKISNNNTEEKIDAQPEERGRGRGEKKRLPQGKQALTCLRWGGRPTRARGGRRGRGAIYPKRVINGKSSARREKGVCSLPGNSERRQRCVEIPGEGGNPPEKRGKRL